MNQWHSVALCAVVLQLSGCLASQPRPQTEHIASAAVRAGSPIVFHTQDEAVNASTQPAGVLPIAEAVRLTLAHDPVLQMALARVRSAEADVDQARLLPNPILSVVVRFPEGGGKTIVEAGLAADLVAILRRPDTASAAYDRLRATSADAVSVVLDSVANVQQTYYTVQSLRAAVPIVTRRRDLIARLQEVARSRLDAGEASQLEVVTLDAQRLEIEAEVDDLLLELTEQQLVLGRLIGSPSFEGDFQIDSWTAPAIENVRETAWLAAALEKRPEIQARLFEIAALGTELRLRRFAILDGLSVGAYAERSDVWSVGPTASGALPVFDWGQAQRSKAGAQLIEARHRLTQTQRQVVEDVRRACAVFNESRHELDRTRKQLIPLQERRRILAEDAFQAGQTDVTTVVIAEQALADAQFRAVELERAHVIALTKLERAVGGSAAALMVIETVPSSTAPASNEFENSTARPNRTSALVPTTQSSIR